jgi:ATP-binding cassette subfamily F protein uup
MIEWLESYFAKENITLFMVTHDRFFLERVCNEIIELDNGKLYQYKGNYSYYLEKKEERIASENASIDKAQNLFVKNWNGCVVNQKRERPNRNHVRMIFMSSNKKPKVAVKKMWWNSKSIWSAWEARLLNCTKFPKSLSDKVILDNFSFDFQRGERIGIIGKNGTGKSTFLNLITGTIPVDGGKVITGDTIKIGYYTQSGINPKPGQKVIDIIKEYGEYIPLTKGKMISAGNCWNVSF